MIYCTFRTKYNWKAVLYLSMIMAYGHSNSYRYYTIYLVLPLIFLIAENKEIIESIQSRFSLYVYYSLFGAVFTIPIWRINGDPERWMSLIAYLLCLYSVVEDIFSVRKGKENILMHYGT